MCEHPRQAVLSITLPCADHNCSDSNGQLFAEVAIPADPVPNAGNYPSEPMPDPARHHHFATLRYRRVRSGDGWLWEFASAS